MHNSVNFQQENLIKWLIFDYNSKRRLVRYKRRLLFLSQKTANFQSTTGVIGKYAHAYGVGCACLWCGYLAVPLRQTMCSSTLFYFQMDNT